jgi:hypothetical protein
MQANCDLNHSSLSVSYNKSLFTLATNISGQISTGQSSKGPSKTCPPYHDVLFPTLAFCSSMSDDPTFLSFLSFINEVLAQSSLTAPAMAEEASRQLLADTKQSVTLKTAGLNQVD